MNLIIKKINLFLISDVVVQKEPTNQNYSRDY